MVQFLAYSLSSPDIEVVQLSLDTLDNLIKYEKNRQVLRTVFGVSEAIKTASERLHIFSCLLVTFSVIMYVLSLQLF